MRWWESIDPYGDYSYDRIDEKFNYPDGAPKKCFKCGNDFFRTNVTDRIDFTVCEMEMICANCKNVAGYWAYGYWYPTYIVKKFTYGRLFKDIRRRVVYEIETLLRKCRLQKNYILSQKVKRKRRSNS